MDRPKEKIYIGLGIHNTFHTVRELDSNIEQEDESEELVLMYEQNIVSHDTKKAYNIKFFVKDFTNNG